MKKLTIGQTYDLNKLKEEGKDRTPNIIIRGEEGWVLYVSEGILREVYNYDLKKFRMMIYPKKGIVLATYNYNQIDNLITPNDMGQGWTPGDAGVKVWKKNLFGFLKEDYGLQNEWNLQNLKEYSFVITNKEDKDHLARLPIPSDYSSLGEMYLYEELSELPVKFPLILMPAFTKVKDPTGTKDLVKPTFEELDLREFAQVCEEITSEIKGDSGNIVWLSDGEDKKKIWWIKNTSMYES